MISIAIELEYLIAEAFENFLGRRYLLSLRK
jgi:hypothetical protein